MYLLKVQELALLKDYCIACHLQTLPVLLKASMTEDVFEKTREHLLNKITMVQSHEEL